jgi:hypothetical protein
MIDSLIEELFLVLGEVLLWVEWLFGNLFVIAFNFYEDSRRYVSCLLEDIVLGYLNLLLGFLCWYALLFFQPEDASSIKRTLESALNGTACTWFNRQEYF